MLDDAIPASEASRDGVISKFVENKLVEASTSEQRRDGETIIDAASKLKTYHTAPHVSRAKGRVFWFGKEEGVHARAYEGHESATGEK